MKKIIPFLILIIFSLTACASLAPKQFVEDNIFYCSYPELKIKINPEFKYLCDVTYNKECDSVDGSRSLRLDIHIYIFIQENATKPYLKKQFQIRTGRIETSFVSNIYGNVENKLEGGMQKLGGKNYHFYTKVVYPSMGHPVTKHLFEEGYILPECVMVKVFGRVGCVKGSFINSIAYLEDISGSVYPCSAWKDKDKLTEDQKKYIKKFDEDFIELFELLEYTPGNKTKEAFKSSIKNLQPLDP